MRFQVPQFIDVEDKIFGPLTFLQFAYLAGGGGIVFLLFKALNPFLAFIIGAPLGVLAAAMAFVKINQKPLIYTMEAAFNYGISSKLYIWKHQKKEEKSEKEKVAVELSKQVQYLPKMSGSKLHDIAWGLDVLDAKRPTKTF